MKRLIIILMLLAALSLSVFTTSADLDTLLELSEYYPAETIAFAAWRTDDATIDSIDDLLMSLARRCARRCRARRREPASSA